MYNSYCGKVPHVLYMYTFDAYMYSHYAYTLSVDGPDPRPAYLTFT